MKLKRIILGLIKFSLRNLNIIICGYLLYGEKQIATNKRQIATNNNARSLIYFHEI